MSKGIKRTLVHALTAAEAASDLDNHESPALMRASLQAEARWAEEMAEEAQAEAIKDMTAREWALLRCLADANQPASKTVRTGMVLMARGLVFKAAGQWQISAAGRRAIAEADALSAAILAS